MAISADFLETLRLQLQTDIQTLFTFGLNQECKVVQEFADTDEIYPCVVVDFSTGSSPSRHLGRPDYDLFHIDFSFLTVRPSMALHVPLCADAKKRSGRELVEYLAIKLNNYLKTYRPVTNIIQTDSDLNLNPEHIEREGIFKTEVVFEFII